MTQRATEVLLALLLVPVPLVVLVGLLRGYTITIHFHREPKQ